MKATYTQWSLLHKSIWLQVYTHGLGSGYVMNLLAALNLTVTSIVDVAESEPLYRRPIHETIDHLRDHLLDVLNSHGIPPLSDLPLTYHNDEAGTW